MAWEELVVGQGGVSRVCHNAMRDVAFEVIVHWGREDGSTILPHGLGRRGIGIDLRNGDGVPWTIGGVVPYSASAGLLLIYVYRGEAGCGKQIPERFSG